MGNVGQRGFTIIEVSAVIAITGLMFFAAMTGITIAVQRQRFSDTVHTTQSYLQSQYDEVVNVINNRPNATICRSVDGAGNPVATSRGSDDCLILGRLLVFTQDDTNEESFIKSYVVVGNPGDVYDTTKSTMQLITDSSPAIISHTTSNNQFLIPWGARLTDTREKTGAVSTRDVQTIAILRSPKDGSLSVYRIDFAALLPTDPLLDPTDTTTWTKPIASAEISFLDNPIQSCLRSGTTPQYLAGLFIDTNPTQQGISTVFDQILETPADNPTGVCPL